MFEAIGLEKFGCKSDRNALIGGEMQKKEFVKPYLVNIKKWKIKNIVMQYLEARDIFKSNRGFLSRTSKVPFQQMRDLSDVLYRTKEDCHLLYKRVIDPQKNKFEDSDKFTPIEYEQALVNNIGLLFHKVLVVRELKYVMEHYVEDKAAYERNVDNYKTQIEYIDSLFDDGIEVLKKLIVHNKHNFLLLTVLLENPNKAKKHFGKNAYELVERFGNGKGLDEIYYSVAQYYLQLGHIERAQKMLRNALKKNKNLTKAKKLMAGI